jgi:hypothetical protein
LIGALAAASAESATSNQDEFREIYKQLIEINTSHSQGDTTIAAHDGAVSTMPAMQAIMRPFRPAQRGDFFNSLVFSLHLREITQRRPAPNSERASQARTSNRHASAGVHAGPDCSAGFASSSGSGHVEPPFRHGRACPGHPRLAS